MDLPIALELMDFVDESTAKKQEIEICLRQSLGTILQNSSLGAGISVHTNSPLMVEHLIEVAFSKIKDVSLTKVKVVEDEVLIDYVFLGKKERVILEDTLR